VFCIILAVGLLSLGFQRISKGNQALAAFFIVAGGIDLIFILLWSNRAHYLTLDTRLESPSFFPEV
jgi:hypothetical protein